ncbi:autotransporter domain-containing protein, partial [Pseudomonas sp. MAFF212428]|nr:autotransporter domain-containing protein [Pseudomonas brassicae]
GGVGISGSNFEVHNATGATISAGSSSSSLMVMPNGAPAIQSSGGSTVYNAGTITGGTGGIGLPSVSQAILFAGGNNTLVLENGSVIQGGVSAGSTDTLALGGASDSTFNVSALNSQYVGFDTFDKRDSSTWTLSGDSTGTSINQWNVKQGTLRTLNNTTLKGNVTVQQGAALQLG